jgi:hypothetical protein
LGNCSDKQSKEHSIPKGIWRSSAITFSGFHWTQGQTKTLPVKNVASKILCGAHNSALSPIDALAQKLFETGARFHNNQFDRGKLKRSAIWRPDRVTFNGYDLERLFAKIATGIMQDEQGKWHLGGTPAIEPPCHVVKAIYGICRFEYPMGLYFVNTVGDVIRNEDRITVHTLLHPDSAGFLGAIIAVRYWQFFINLSDLNPHAYSMSSVSGKAIGLNGSPPIYRIEQMNFNAGSKLSGRITIEWPGFDRSISETT